VGQMLPARVRGLQVLVALTLTLSGLGFLPLGAQAAEPPPELGIGAKHYEACERLGGTVPGTRYHPGFRRMYQGIALSLPAFTFDMPVQDNKEGSWLFGASYGVIFVEPYHDASLLGDWNCIAPRTTQGMRWVMYFDKGRIELGHVPAEAFWLRLNYEVVEVEVEGRGERRKIPVFLYRAGWDPDSSISLWALTSGNLARELLTGQLQLGDAGRSRWGTSAGTTSLGVIIRSQETAGSSLGGGGMTLINGNHPFWTAGSRWASYSARACNVPWGSGIWSSPRLQRGHRGGSGSTPRVTCSLSCCSAW
jgi:hypothetical protein